MKLKLAVLTVFLISTLGTAAAQDSYVSVKTSDITGGNAFEQGKTIQLGYAIETNIGGTLYFLIDGNRVASDQPYTGSEQTYEYRWDTDDVSIGNHTYHAKFIDTEGKEYTTEIKEIQIVEATEESSEEKVIIKEGDGGQKIFDNLIEFPDQRYTPSWGFQTTKNFEIVNHRDKEEFVTVEVPDKPGCQYIRLQKNNDGKTSDVEYGKRAIYELPPVSTDPSKSAVSIKPLMQISAPTREQFENSGLEMPLTCQLEVEHEEAGTFFVEIRPTDSFFLKTYNEVVKATSPAGDNNLSVAGMQVAPLTLVVWIIIILIVLGVGAAYVKNQVIG